MPHALPVGDFDFAASGRRVFDIERDGLAAVAARIDGAFSAACRAILASRGRVVFDGSSDLITNDRLREIYKTASEELILPDASEVRDRPRFSPGAEAALACDPRLADDGRISLTLALDPLEDGWQAQTTLEQLCDMMVKADLERNRAGVSF